MSAFPPPNPYFNGIIYDSAFFEIPALTLSEANAKYLKKTTPDIASALETFSGGILTDAINPTTIGGTIQIGHGATNNNVEVAAQVNRSVVLHLGDGNTSSGAIHIGNGTGSSNNVNILNGTYTTGQTAGTVNILTGSHTGTITNGNVNIQSGTSKGSLNIGNVNSTLTINTPITVGYTAAPSTVNMIGYQQQVSGSFTAPVPATVSTLICYFSIPPASLPAGLYHAQYSVSTGGITSYYYASILAPVGAVVDGTTTGTASSTYGVGMLNAPSSAVAGRASTHIANSAMIRLDGTQSICLGYLSGTSLTFTGKLQITRIA